MNPPTLFHGGPFDGFISTKVAADRRFVHVHSTQAMDEPTKPNTRLASDRGVYVRNEQNTFHWRTTP